MSESIKSQINYPWVVLESEEVNGRRGARKNSYRVFSGKIGPQRDACKSANTKNFSEHSVFDYPIRPDLLIPVFVIIFSNNRRLFPQGRLFLTI